MNKKGFTLTELLATMVIIGIVTSIAAGGIMVISNNIKKSMLSTKKSFILTGAVEYGQENRIHLNEANCPSSVAHTRCNVVTIGQLQENYLEANEKCEGDVWCFKNNVTNKNMNNDEILVYIQNSRVYAEFYSNPSDTP